MGNSLFSNSSGGSISHECCNPVVDPLSLLAAIGAIAAVSLFLRQAVIDNMITGGKKRSNGGSIGEQIKEVLIKGRSLLTIEQKALIKLS